MTTQYQAQKLVGTGQYLSSVEVPFDYDEDYTVAGWMYLREPGFSEYPLSIAYDGNNNNRDFIRHHASDYFRLYSYVGTVRDFYINGPSLSDSYDEWHHVTLRREASGLSIWLDGDFYVSDTNSIDLDRTAANQFNIGRRGGSSGWDSTNIADYYGFKAWTRALSQNEIKAEMRFVTPVSRRGLWAYWPNCLKDHSGNGRDLVESEGLTETSSPPLAWKRQRHQYIMSDITPPNISLPFGALNIKLY